MGDDAQPTVDSASMAPMGSAVAGGAVWASFGRIGAQVVQFAAGLVLARLLTPSEFGLFATVLIFTGLAGIMFELGLGSALIHAREPDESDYSTVFWINAIGGVVLAGALAACGPALAAFFDEPQLATLTPIAALAFTLNLSICQLALLQRHMEFRRLALVELGATLFSYVLGISAAASGWGAYSLAVVTVSFSAANSLLLWFLVPWRPQKFISTTSLRQLWEFSRGLLGSNVIDHLGRNVDGLLIAKFAGTQPLGYYNRAYNLMSLPVQQVGTVMGRVMFPALVSIRDDHVRVARGHRRAVKLINVLSAPLLVGMAAVSPSLVPFLWGEQWTPVVPLLIVVCIAALPQCMSASATWLYQSQGRTGLMFKMDVMTSVLGLAGMLVGVHWGAIGVAWAVLVREWVFGIPSFYVACRLVGSSAWRVFGDSGLTALSAVCMGATVWFLPEVMGFDREAPLTLLGQVVTGVAVYAVATLLLQRAVLVEIRGLRRLRPMGSSN